MVVKSVDDDDSSDEKLNGIQKVSYLHGEKRFAIGVDISFLSSGLRSLPESVPTQLRISRAIMRASFSKSRMSIVNGLHTCTRTGPDQQKS